MKILLTGLFFAAMPPWIVLAAVSSDHEKDVKKAKVVVMTAPDGEKCCEKTVVKKGGKFIVRGGDGDDKAVKIVVKGDGDHDGHAFFVDDKDHGKKTAKRFVVRGGNADVDDEDVKVFVKKLDGHDGDAFFIGDDEDGNRVAKRFVARSGDDDDEGVKWYVQGDGGHAYANAVVLLGSDDDGRSEGGNRFVFRSGGPKNDGGWLGVSVGNVPEALADQLDLDGRGVMILNVVDDSPADEAGLLAHDVIVSVGGEDIGSDVTHVVKVLGSHKPGDEVPLYVIRDGRKVKVVATLGSRADVAGGKVEWKFEGLPDIELEDKISTKGRMMFRGDDGEWVVKDLGDLQGIAELPDNIKMVLPKSGNRTVQVYADGGQRTVKTRVEHDGNVLVLKQEDGDGITVTRVNEDGEETELVFDNEDELREADEEAWELLTSSGKDHFFHVDLDDLHDAIDDVDMDFDFDVQFDSDDWAEHMGEWQAHLDESLAGAHEAYAASMEEYRALMEQLKEEGDDVDFKVLRFPQIAKDLHGKFGGPLMKLHQVGKPKHSFEVRSDGTIEVRSRKGDSELVQLFDSEDDLARRNPTLHERFKALTSVEPE